MRSKTCTRSRASAAARRAKPALLGRQRNDVFEPRAHALFAHRPLSAEAADALRDVQSMLLEGSLPLIDIAARVGFQTQQHFTAPRAFRLAHHRLRSRDALSAGSVSDQQTQEFDTFGQGLERRARLAGVGLTGIGAAPSFPTSKTHRCTHGRILGPASTYPVAHFGERHED